MNNIIIFFDNNSNDPAVYNLDDCSASGLDSATDYHYTCNPDTDWDRVYCRIDGVYFRVNCDDTHSIVAAAIPSYARV